MPGRGEDKQDCLSSRAQALWPDALVVHRLDMATSGLFLMGRGIHMQRVLSRAFAQRQVDKRYVAVVAGRMEGDSGVIELPIGADYVGMTVETTPDQVVRVADDQIVVRSRA